MVISIGGKIRVWKWVCPRCGWTAPVKGTPVQNTAINAGMDHLPACPDCGEALRTKEIPHFDSEKQLGPKFPLEE